MVSPLSLRKNPHARVQRSPAIMKVAVPWLQHSQRFGHCALSQTVCNRKSEISALVEKKTGFDGNRTLIQGGFCAWCRAGSIFAQDISKKSYNVKNVTKVKTPGTILNSSTGPRCPHHVAHLLETISVCLDPAAPLASASCRRFSPLGLGSTAS
jgi:hypothetical protein